MCCLILDRFSNLNSKLSSKMTTYRTPMFVYDIESHDIDIIFIPQHIVDSKELILEDLFVGTGQKMVIQISVTSEVFPHRLLIHRNGHDFHMISITSEIFEQMKSYALTKLLISHTFKDISMDSHKKDSTRKKCVRRSPLSREIHV